MNFNMTVTLPNHRLRRVSVIKQTLKNLQAHMLSPIKQKQPETAVYAGVILGLHPANER